MHILNRLTWITVAVLALSAEGSAVAQSAPAGAGGASRAGAPKKADTGAAVDLSSLANREAAAGNAVAGGLVLPSGAGAPIQSTAGGADGLQMLRGDATGTTPATAGQATRVVPVGDIQGGASSARATRADAVIRGQINPAARSCYENDPDSKSKQPGRLVILIKLTAAGEIDSVSVASNVGLSASVVTCITAAAGAAKFGAPGANGATVRAAFAFPRQEDQAPPAIARAKGAPAANASGTLAKADNPPTNGQTAHR